MYRTNSVKQSHSWEANSFSVSQEIPHILWSLRVYTTFTCSYPDPKDQSKYEALWKLHSLSRFLWWDVVTTLPNPQAGGPPLSSCLRLLIQCIRSYPPYPKAVRPSTNWGCLTPWWKGLIYHGRNVQNGDISSVLQNKAFKHQKLLLQTEHV